MFDLKYQLNSSSLWRTTAIVRKWSDINNLNHLDACTMNSADSRLTTIARTLHICLHLAQTQVVCCLCTVLSSHLGSIRSVLLRATETHLSCRRPRNDLTFAVGQRDNDIVERAVYVELTHSVNLHYSLLCSNCFLCHIIYYLVAFFLLATVFFLPLRVRALFLVL